MELIITVPGPPQSKGSRVQMGGQNLESGTKRSRARKARSARSIAVYAVAAFKKLDLPAGTLPLTCAVRIDAWFFFPIPPSRMKGKKAVKPGEPHIQKPDRDKCNRHVNDPLTKSGLLADDCLDASGWSAKLWCLPGDERTEIRVRW